MAIRVRPATTLCVILVIAFAFQLIAVLTVPVTKSISLCTYGGVRFGVFGLCTDSACSSVGVGYSVADVDIDGFSLPSNARHSVSKLLVVHPIAAGFTAVLLLCCFALHFHGPSTSLRFLFFVLLWTIPSFLLALLAFLVDILLFIPHLDWAGWIVLASTVLVAVCSILLCIMRRTVSSRKSASRYSNLNNGAEYQLAPLNYGYGTVDGGPGLAYSTKNDEDSEERAINDYEESVNVTRTHDDLNEVEQTEIYDSMRGHSAQTNPETYRSNDILTPVTKAYRAEYDRAPYPQNVPSVSFDDAPAVGMFTFSAPYPQDPFASSPTPLNGPRPMPKSRNSVDSPLLPSDIEQFPQNGSWTFSQDVEDQDPLVPPLPSTDQGVERAPTYRTRIAQNLDALQPEVSYSTDSIGGTTDNLLATRHRAVDELDSEDDTTQELTHDTLDEDDVYQVSPQYPSQQSLAIPDDSSSVYSSKPPSTNPTPVNATFPRHLPSMLQRSIIPEDSVKDVIYVESPQTEVSDGHFPFPDPNDRRTTPAPSFSNESIGSSTFTSVSQRGINPEYLRQHPEEQNERLQKQIFDKLRTPSQRTDLLIDSNPDFSISARRRGK